METGAFLRWNVFPLFYRDDLDSDLKTKADRVSGEFWINKKAIIELSVNDTFL